ncbi:B12-binding domain-containing radical SAM protein [Bacillota bacterium LX-D]|nr:B12-binding domain-containing radical SAM protein [Bacillota bacterium LX-D]
MKVLLTTLNSKHIHSSLSIYYLQSYCQKFRDNISIQEFTINQNEDKILAELYKGSYDLICFSCYIWNITKTLEIIEHLKKVQPKVKILLGGPEVTYDPQEILTEHLSIDYIICGEGEETFQELLNHLILGQGNLEDIKGLVYRLDQRITVNQPRPLIQQLDKIPFPYLENMDSLTNKIIYYESSRGCPHSCTYCLSSTIKGVRFFSLPRIKKDLQFFLDARVQQVKFVDRTFNVKKSHCLEIWQFIAAHDNGYTNFHFEITGDLLDEEELNFLSKVRPGLFQFEIGVQSTCEETMEAINRQVDLQKLSKSIKRLLATPNIHLHLDLIAGLPKEGYTTFQTSFNQVYALQPHNLQLGFLKLLKGSAIREQQQLYNYLYKSTPPYEVLQNKFISYKEILALKNIEELLELYFNSGSFQFSLEFICTNFYQSSFRFYEDLSNYWEHNGLYSLAHSQKELYKILLTFYQNMELPHVHVFIEVLKLDYLCHVKSIVPDFLHGVDDPHFKNKCYEFLRVPEHIQHYLPHYSSLSAKQIAKKVHFEHFNYNVQKIIKNPGGKNYTPDKVTLLFDYGHPSKHFKRSPFILVPVNIE